MLVMAVIANLLEYLHFPDLAYLLLNVLTIIMWKAPENKKESFL